MSLKTVATERYRELNDRFRALSVREQTLYSAVVVASFFLIIDQLMLQPVTEERDRVARGTEFARASIDRSTATIEQLDNTVLSQKEREAQERIELLQAQIGEIENQMKTTVESLVPPSAIVSILEELLATSGDLELVELRSHAPQPITSQPAAESGSQKTMDRSPGAEDSTLYRHGLTLEIQGSFVATADYLRRLEASPWHLLWERFEYTVEEHPVARIRIDLHTISDQEEWIRV